MRTTQEVTAKYTELYDISTDIGKNVHYKIHTPTGVAHMKKLAGFYKQFKEYKYLGASITWVPITTLPKDLLNVGYEAGDSVDPRDLVNPILHKGYKGEHLVTDYMSERALWSENEDATDKGRQMFPDIRSPIARMTESGGVSKIGMIGDEEEDPTVHDFLKGMYYTSLTNPEWSKAHPREGFYRELFPVVRTLASTGRIGQAGVPMADLGLQRKSQVNEKAEFESGADSNYKEHSREIERLGTILENPANASIDKGGAYTNIPNRGVDSGAIDGTRINDPLNTQRSYTAVNQTDIFSHEFERLGWMETSGKGYLPATSYAYSKQLNVFNEGGESLISQAMTDLDLNRMPKVYMYLVQTPPAYKQKQYYRMAITHNFAFRKFREVYGIDMPNIWSDQKAHHNISDAVNLPSGVKNNKVIGLKMMDHSGRIHDGDFEIPPYVPELENSIQADGNGVTITKISDGAL